MPEPIALVVNTSSGVRASRERPARAQAALRAVGLDAELLAARPGDDVTALARGAIDRGARIIVACGGDGTINSVASAVVHTPAAMAVLPGGTINHFARYLGIPLDLEGAARIAAEGATAQLSVGEVNGQLFVNNSTVGMYPGVVTHREWLRRERGMPKWPAFAWAMAAGLARARTRTLRLIADDRDEILTTPFVFVAANDFRLGALALDGDAHVPPGELGVCVARARSRGETARLAAAAAAGTLRGHPEVAIFRTRALRLEFADRAVDLTTDGEVLRQLSPLVYRPLDRALRVLVPVDFATRIAHEAAPETDAARPSRLLRHP